MQGNAPGGFKGQDTRSQAGDSAAGSQGGLTAWLRGGLGLIGHPGDPVPPRRPLQLATPKEAWIVFAILLAAAAVALFYLLRFIGKYDADSTAIDLVRIALLGGTLGGLAHAISSLSFHLGNGTLYSNYTVWYLSRPFMGALVAVILHFVLQAGFAETKEKTAGMPPGGSALTQAAPQGAGGSSVSGAVPALPVDANRRGDPNRQSGAGPEDSDPKAKARGEKLTRKEKAAHALWSALAWSALAGLFSYRILEKLRDLLNALVPSMKEIASGEATGAGPPGQPVPASPDEGDDADAMPAGETPAPEGGAPGGGGDDSKAG